MPRLGDRKELRGAEFGLWLVLGDAPDIYEGWWNRRGKRTPRRVRMLRCRCKGCGVEAVVRHCVLTASGRQRSLGCPDCRPGGKPSREEDWFKALDLYRQGYTYKAVGLKLGVGESGAKRMANKARAYYRQQRERQQQLNEHLDDTSTEGK